MFACFSHASIPLCQQLLVTLADTFRVIYTAARHHNVLHRHISAGNVRMSSKVDWKAKFTDPTSRCVDLLDRDSLQDDVACVVIDLGHSTCLDARRETKFLDNLISGTWAYYGRTALDDYQAMIEIKRDARKYEAALKGEIMRSERLMRFLERHDDAESAMLVVLVQVQEILKVREGEVVGCGTRPSTESIIRRKPNGLS